MFYLLKVQLNIFLGTLMKGRIWGPCGAFRGVWGIGSTSKPVIRETMMRGEVWQSGRGPHARVCVCVGECLHVSVFVRVWESVFVCVCVSLPTQPLCWRTRVGGLHGKWHPIPFNRLLEPAGLKARLTKSASSNRQCNRSQKWSYLYHVPPSGITLLWTRR